MGYAPSWVCRGLAIPERSAVDRPCTLIVSGLAARKQQIFADLVVAHAVAAFPPTVAMSTGGKGARRHSAVIASRNSGAVLATAGVTGNCSPRLSTPARRNLHQRQAVGRPFPLDSRSTAQLQPDNPVPVDAREVASAGQKPGATQLQSDESSSGADRTGGTTRT
jgi:hypothetical protein